MRGFWWWQREYVSGELGGDGELEELRFYGMTEALAMISPRRHAGAGTAEVVAGLSEAERLARPTRRCCVSDRGWSME